MIIRTLAFGAGLAGAVAASQLPEYAQQYRQRLGGAIDEISRIMAEFDADAARIGLSREQDISRLREFGPFRDGSRRSPARGQRAARAVAAGVLRPAYGGAFARVAVMATDAALDCEPRVGQFRAAVPVTIEGAALGGADSLPAMARCDLSSARGRRRKVRVGGARG